MGYISMYSGLYDNGYVKNIPSSPMCACVEQMATVTNSDCTKVDVTESYEFTLTSNGLEAQLDADLSYVTCGTNLVDYYSSTASADEVSALTSKHIVSECSSEDFLNTNYYVPGSLPTYVDASEWELVVGEDRMFYPPIGDSAFRALIEASPNDIIYRRCLGCRTSHRHIYYKRITPIPSANEVDFLDLFQNNWRNEPDNRLGVDFNLYSTYEDALAETNAWTFCNYNDNGIGFPRDCGPTGQVGNQWNSYVRNGGQADNHAFYVEKSVAADASS